MQVIVKWHYHKSFKPVNGDFSLWEFALPIPEEIAELPKGERSDQIALYIAELSDSFFPEVSGWTWEIAEEGDRQ